MVLFMCLWSMYGSNADIVLFGFVDQSIVCISRLAGVHYDDVSLCIDSITICQVRIDSLQLPRLFIFVPLPPDCLDISGAKDLTAGTAGDVHQS